MESAPAHEIYPQYCFHKSPTIKGWCCLRSSDIAKLWRPPGFEGQDVFFYDNHPIQWVRIAGVVVAVDEYKASEASVRRVYTVDDSSGITIECITLLAAKQPRQLALGILSADSGVQQRKEQQDQQEQEQEQQQEQQQQQQQKDPLDFDVGQVVEIRGSLKIFRRRNEAQLQINIVRAKPILSTQHEVDFWRKTAKLHETLSRPWVLDESVVSRCRREAEEDELLARKKKRRTGKASSHVPDASVSSAREGAKEASGSKDGRGICQTSEPAAPAGGSIAPQVITGLERKKGAKHGSKSKHKNKIHYTHEPAVLAGSSTGQRVVTGLEREKKVKHASESKDNNSIHRMHQPGVPAADGTDQQIATGLEKKRGVKHACGSSSGDGLHHSHGNPVVVPAASIAVPQLLTGLEKTGAKHASSSKTADGLRGRHDKPVVQDAGSAVPKLSTGLERKRRRPKAC